MECKWKDECKTKGCLFNHPSRDGCRNGEECSRTDCFYNHRIILCSFLQRCTKQNCQFRHPPLHTVKNVPIKNAISTASETPRQPNNVIVKNLCKWDTECNTPGCFHNHSTRKLCKYGENCLTADCFYNNETTLCKFQNSCSNPHCAFRHPEAIVARQQNLPGPSTGSNNHFKQTANDIDSKYLPGTSSKNNLEQPRKVVRDFTTLENSKQISSEVICPSPDSVVLKNQQGPSKGKENEEKRLTYEEKVIAAHEKETKKVLDKILAILSESWNEPNEKTLDTLKALRKQQEELLAQLHAYNEAKTRAILSLSGKECQLQLKREIYRLKSRLPTLAHRKEIENRISEGNSRFLVIQGQTGSGKSSQIAQYVADHPKFSGKKVVVTQPRKIAAVSLATRVSMEYSGGSPNSKPGFQVGYHVGGRKVGGKKLKIEFVTEGVMLERIMQGTFDSFQDVGCIVIDEAHERSVTCDILLGSFKKEDPRWKNILIIVTSATIDLDQFSKFFDNTIPIEISGRTFPVDITYHPNAENSGARVVDSVVNCALGIHKSCQKAQGDILCFLPGQDDVLNAQAMFELKSNINFRKSDNQLLGIKVFALFGRQDPEIQNEVFKKLPANVRKIIFATDVAETSITIDGVVFVVDSGLRKEMGYDPKRNISSLKVQTISRSSAIQRAGRSGRTQPGQCFRLYSQQDYEEMEINGAPEIFRKPLSLAILSLRDMRIVPLEFDWISQPSMEAITAAENELRFLGAVDRSGRPTELGKLISLSQQDPKLVKMIYRGCQLGFGGAALIISAILSVSNIFFWNGNDPASKEMSKICRNSFADKDGDIVTMFQLFHHWNHIREGNSEERFQESQNRENISEENFLEPEEQVFDMLLPGNFEGEVNFEVTVNLDRNDEDDDLIDFETESQDGSEANSIGISECSEITLESELDIESKKLKRKNGAKFAAAWCRNSFVNGKAMGLISSMRSELLGIFKNTEVWKLCPNQNLEPNSNEIRRLIFSGYFLHTARKIHTKNSKTVQYFAIYPEVIGSLDFKSAISTISKSGSSELPSWIIYDKILRLSSTIFPTSSVVDESWIEEEHPEFSELCFKKLKNLPTERIEHQASPENIRLIFGKYFSNMSILEQEFGCALEADGKSGIIVAFTSEEKKGNIELLLGNKIKEAMESLKNQIVEQEYQNGTRAVIGFGYQVQEILFPDDFITIYIRKLPRLTKHQLLRECPRMLPQQIRSLEMIDHETSSMAILNFFRKLDAKKVFDNLKGEIILGNEIEVSTRKAEAAQRKFRQGESSRLKFSWPLSPATGKATLNFKSHRDANLCIERIPLIFHGCKVAAVHGDRVGHGIRIPPREGNTNRQLPIVRSHPSVLRNSPACRFRFAELQPPGLDYRITVLGLRENIDEIAIMTSLSYFPPQWVKIERNTEDGLSNSGENPLLMDERMKKLDTIKNFVNKDTVTSDFFEKNSNRAGIYVYLEDSQTCEEAYHEALKKFQENSNLSWTRNGQPIRVELELTKSTSVHTDLYEFLKEGIENVKTRARADGLTVTENKPTQGAKSNFVVIKFRHKSKNIVDKYQKLLEDALKSEKLVLESQEILFSWTGRMVMQKLSQKTYLHWDNRNHDIWAYGSESQQRRIKIQLQKIISDLKALEIDKLYLLDKNVVDLAKLKDKSAVEFLCRKMSLYHYHFHGRNQLFATGGKKILERLEKVLEEKGFLFRRKDANLQGDNKMDCGLCMCPLEPGFLLTSECNHPFCISCFAGMFGSLTASVPINCPTCGKPMVINDILKVAPPGSLHKFLETSIFEFQAKHSDQIVVCPKPGCNQMLNVQAAKKGKYGGTFQYCNECVTTFCLDCCKALDKIVQSHENDSCDFIRNGLSSEVMQQVKRVQNNILNLQCPKCKAAFFEFDGCAAVTCESCKTGFCGVCLSDCGNSMNAHTHVRTCPKNPNRGNYHVSKEQLDIAHKNKRIEELSAYFRTILNRELRGKVLMALRRDLADLGINVDQF